MDNNQSTIIDDILNSPDVPLTDSQIINNINIDSNMNFDDLLKFTEGYELLAEIPKSTQIPKFKNSIEFINYMETFYIESTMNKNKSIFKLSNISENIKKKPTILKFPNKQSLTKKIYNESTPIYSITEKYDLIFTGDSMGKIKMFSCEKECEIKSFFNKEIENTKVLCMDISDDKTTLLAGYSNASK